MTPTAAQPIERESDQHPHDPPVQRPAHLDDEEVHALTSSCAGRGSRLR